MICEFWTWSGLISHAFFHARCICAVCCLRLRCICFCEREERYRSPHRLSDTICIQNSASAMKCSNSLCEHQTLTCMSRQKLLAWALWGRIWGTPQNNTIQLKSDQTWLEFSYEKKKANSLKGKGCQNRKEAHLFSGDVTFPLHWFYPCVRPFILDFR